MCSGAASGRLLLQNLPSRVRSVVACSDREAAVGSTIHSPLVPAGFACGTVGEIWAPGPLRTGPRSLCYSRQVSEPL